MKTGLPLPLVGHDGNVFAILGRATCTLRRSGRPDRIDEIRRLSDEVLASQTYDEALTVFSDWFETEVSSDYSEAEIEAVSGDYSREREYR